MIEPKSIILPESGLGQGLVRSEGLLELDGNPIGDLKFGSIPGLRKTILAGGFFYTGTLRSTIGLYDYVEVLEANQPSHNLTIEIPSIGGERRVWVDAILFFDIDGFFTVQLLPPNGVFPTTLIARLIATSGANKSSLGTSAIFINSSGKVLRVRGFVDNTDTNPQGFSLLFKASQQIMLSPSTVRVKQTGVVNATEDIPLLPPTPFSFAGGTIVMEVDTTTPIPFSFNGGTIVMEVVNGVAVVPDGALLVGNILMEIDTSTTIQQVLGVANVLMQVVIGSYQVPDGEHLPSNIEMEIV
ncbi:MAG: hypothetical protein ACRC78_02690 [Planktothrix sp.]